jgi:hypothetical protein
MKKIPIPHLSTDHQEITARSKLIYKRWAGPGLGPADDHRLRRPVLLRLYKHRKQLIRGHWFHLLIFVALVWPNLCSIPSLCPGCPLVFPRQANRRHRICAPEAGRWPS